MMGKATSPPRSSTQLFVRGGVRGPPGCDPVCAASLPQATAWSVAATAAGGAGEPVGLAAAGTTGVMARLPTSARAPTIRFNRYSTLINSSQAVFNGQGSSIRADELDGGGGPT